LKTRTAAPSASPRAEASSECIRTTGSAPWNSPNIELIVRGLAGLMSVNG
jgi:hypothetical protein